jgi:hypothetical protein
MASTRYYGQWRVGFVVRTEFNNWRRARVQDNRTSWISRSPIFVNSRSWRRDCSFPNGLADEPVPLFPGDERLNGRGQTGDWTLVAP